jgi:hypothetical protein
LNVGSLLGMILLESPGGDVPSEIVAHVKAGSASVDLDNWSLPNPHLLQSALKTIGINLPSDGTEFGVSFDDGVAPDGPIRKLAMSAIEDFLTALHYAVS